MSPYCLLQEYLDQDAWKIFVACIFCNLTSRKVAEPIFWKVLKKWPTAKDMSTADINELKAEIKDLGLVERRSKALKHMSYDYIRKDWKENPTALYGIGKYGSDAYYLFCTEKWRHVQPKDYALKLYKDWLNKNFK